MQKFEDIEYKIRSVYVYYLKISELVGFEEVQADSKLFLRLNRERQKLSTLAEKYHEYIYLKSDIDFLEKEISNTEKSSPQGQGIQKSEWLEEQDRLCLRANVLEEEMLSIYQNMDAKYESIMLVLGGSKGVLGEKIKSDILSSCQKFACNNGYEVKKGSDGSLAIFGGNVKQVFSSEIGKHLAQRNSDVGQCLVFVIDSVQEVVPFSLSDTRVDTLRASGAGGQHINTTDSAIRLTHLPTGLSVISQDERSQIQNRRVAEERLKEKVEEFYSKTRKEYLDSKIKKQLKEMGSREIKKYDYGLGIVERKNGETLSLNDFLSGKII